jgi:hypothetical protein
MPRLKTRVPRPCPHLLSAAVSRTEQLLNAPRRRTGSLGNRGTRRCEIRSGAVPAGPSSSAPEWRNVRKMICRRRVGGQSKQWLTDSFSHRKSVVLQVYSRL